MAANTYTNGNRNLARVLRLLTGVATPVLRHLFEKYALSQGVNTVDDFLKTQSKPLELCVRNKSLQKYQYNTVFPQGVILSNFVSWDLSLLCCLLKICFKKLLSQVEKNAIDILRDKRNDFCHATESSLSEKSFQTIWKELDSAINDILYVINDLALTTEFQEIMKDLKSKHIEEDVLNNIYGMLRLKSESEKTEPDYEDGKLKLQSFLVKTYTEQQLQIISLPISETACEGKAHVDKLYVEENIIELTQHMQTSVSGSLENFADSFLQFFQPTDTDNPPRHVVLLGSAGRGKTSFCLRLVSLWCSAMAMNKAEKDLTEIEKNIVSRFQLLYYIPLRNTSGETCVQEMIKSQILVENKDFLQQVCECFKKEPEKCLVIIDGLDEWDYSQESILPKTTNLNYCPILWTSRHSKLHLFQNTLQRIFEITNLNDANIRSLVRNVLHTSKSDRSSTTEIDKKVTDFMSSLKKHDMKLIAEIPIVLAYLVRSWDQKSNQEKEKGLKKESRTAIFCGILNYLLVGKNSVAEGGDTNVEVSNYRNYFPDILHMHNHINMYSQLLESICKFAYDSYLQSKIDGFKEVEKEIGKKNVETCLKTGLLSKRGDKIQFFHKTIQDFLAAIWISRKDPTNKTLDKVFGKCKSTEDIIEISTILISICGMRPTKTREISQFISRLAFKDELIREYRQTLQGRHGFSGRRPVAGSASYRRVKKIQQIMLDCRNEMELSSKNEKGKFRTYHGVLYVKRSFDFQLHDIIIEDKVDDEVSKIIKEKETINNLLSIYIDLSINQTVDEIAKAIRKTKTLKRLYLDHSSSEDVISVMEPKQLKIVESLCLVNIASFPQSMKYLENIAALCLAMRCTHEDVKKLEAFLKTSTNLKELDLEEIICSDHKSKENRDCDYHIDITSSTNTKRLRLEYVLSKSITLPDQVCLEDVWVSGSALNPSSCLHRLPQSKYLTSLTIGQSDDNTFVWTKEDYEAVACILNELCYLEHVYLIGIDFEQYSLTPTFYCHSKLNTVSLEKIKLTENGWKRLLLSLTEHDKDENKCNAEVHLISTNIERHMVILSKISDVKVQDKMPKIVLDLTQQQFYDRLRSLKE